MFFDQGINFSPLRILAEPFGICSLVISGLALHNEYDGEFMAEIGYS